MKKEMLQNGERDEFPHNRSSKGRWKQVEEFCNSFPLFGVETFLFRADWLRVVDAGLGADLAGNVFEALLLNSQEAARQLGAVLSMLSCKGFFRHLGIEDKLDGPTPASFWRPAPTQPAKSRGSAAEVRTVMPFA